MNSESGSADPETNASLASALRRAKDAGIPKENIEKALKRVREYFLLAVSF